MGIRIGVVGMGIGRTHAHNLASLPDTKVVAVADLDIEKARKIAGDVGGVAYLDWQSLLDDAADLDAVVLATPASVREEPIRAICDRGLALLCEKPPALTAAEASRIQQAIEDAGVLNTVGFMYRWHPLATRMRELVGGRPQLFARSVVAWPILPKSAQGLFPRGLFTKAGCGGPLIEQAVHFQDVLRYITGDDPVSVQAMAEMGDLVTREGRDSEETTAYMIRHESGMLSMHIHNWSHRGMILQIQVVGENLDLTLQLEGGSWLRGTVDGATIDESWDGEIYLTEMTGVVDAWKKGEQSMLRSSYRDACRSFSVCQAAARAVETGAVETVSYLNEVPVLGGVA